MKENKKKIDQSLSPVIKTVWPLIEYGLYSSFGILELLYVYKLTRNWLWRELDRHLKKNLKNHFWLLDSKIKIYSS